MEGQFENSAEEIKRLRRCINDLVSVLALPATWSGYEPSQIVRTLFDVLLGILPLDLIYLRLKDPGNEAPIEMSWVAEPQRVENGTQEIGVLLDQWLGPDSQKWLSSVRKRIGDEEISLVPFRLGLQDDIGVIVAGSQRVDFPSQTERLLLNVAANQAAIWLQEARRMGEQKQLASELDLRVAEQTVELATANLELKKEIAERSQVEERLRKEERELKSSEARKTAILDSALDCIVTIDHEARITEFNPAAERTFGYRRDEVVGKSLADIIVPPSLRDAHQRGFARYLATGEARVLGKRIEMTAARADGSEFPVELAITRIPLDGPPSFTGYLRDITERKEAEEKLRRSEAYLAEAQKLSKTGSFGWNVSTDEHFWSEETSRIFEYDPSAKISLQMVLERIHPEDVASLKQTLERAAQDGKDWEHEHRLLLPDGTIKHLHVVARAEKDRADGIEFVGAVMDVTERKRTEARIRQIIDTIPVYAWSAEHDGAVDFINRPYLNFTGRPVEELLGWGWSSTCHPDDLPAYLTARRAAIAAGMPVETEVRVRRRDANYRWLWIRNVPLRDGTGNIVKWYGTAVDITERKQAEAKLLLNEAYLSEAQRLSHTGSFGWRISDGELFWSEETFQIFQYDRALKPTVELILQRVHPDDAVLVQATIKRASQDAKGFDFEHRLLMPDGSTKHLHVVAHATSSKSGDPEFVGAVMDITAARRIEEALRRGQSELAHASRVTTLGEFTASIAHEVNQPLTAVINNANACLGLLPELDPNLNEVKSALSEIIEDADRASAIIKRVRQLARKAPPDKALLEMKNVVADVLALARYEIATRRVTIINELPESLPSVFGDRVQLQQVLLNLIVNGMDAMSAIEESRRVVNISGGLELQEGMPICLLRVQDAGVGLKQNEMDKLFEAFHTTKPQGMGMGLAISRSIIEAHGGRLWAEPNQGAGATFLFRLPAAGKATS
jgi:PAS domain S-box-containing protein